MASAINAISTLSGATTTPASTTTGAAPTEDMFLQLLVAQIKDQDPLNPTDSTQFVSQLAQFSELEQVMAIRSDLDTSMANTAATASASANTGSKAISPDMSTGSTTTVTNGQNN